MINFIICDDEKLITKKVRDIITKNIFKTNIDYKIYEFNAYDSNFKKIMSSNLDNKIYILDIEVNDKSGIDIAKEIRKTDWESSIMILTSHSELETFAIKSRTMLIDFISKFDMYDNRLSRTIMLCVNKKISDNKLLVTIDRKYVKINMNDILYITYELYIRKSKIVTINDEIYVSESLTSIKDRLKGNFIFSHKSCIVNLNKIKKIDPNTHIIYFENNISTDLLSRRHFKEVISYDNS